jgi:hypothetical protein
MITMKGLKTAAVGLGLALGLFGSSTQAGNGPRLISGGGTDSGGTLTVDRRGADFVLPGGAKLHAAPGSVIRVFPRAQKLELLPHQKISTYSVILKAGRVDVAMPANTAEPSAVLVSTSKDAGGIVMKGNFTAIASKGHALHANRDGDVLVKIGAGWKPLAVGQEQTLIAGTESHIAPLLDAPRVSGRFLRVAFDDKAVPLDDVEWQPIHGAKSYQVVLTGGSAPLEATTPSTRLPTAMASVAPGTYTLKVRAVDADGMEGRGWASTEVNVVRVGVPQGSLVGSNATVYLAPRAVVELEHVRGLEMTLNKADLFVAAASKVGLYRDEPTTVVLRRPGSKQTFRLHLEPRGVEADVVLGPAAAVWPRDFIDIDIRVHGPKGAALDSIEPKPRVTLGVDELDLKWARVGHRMHARVHPRRGIGPWVLRVEVTDRQGVLLGRNFVEIAMDPRISSAE